MKLFGVHWKRTFLKWVPYIRNVNQLAATALSTFGTNSGFSATYNTNVTHLFKTCQREVDYAPCISCFVCVRANSICAVLFEAAAAAYIHIHIHNHRIVPFNILCYVRIHTHAKVNHANNIRSVVESQQFENMAYWMVNWISVTK